jgi:hypothetical protein
MSYIDKIKTNTLRCHGASRTEWSCILNIISVISIFYINENIVTINLHIIQVLL